MQTIYHDNKRYIPLNEFADKYNLKVPTARNYINLYTIDYIRINQKIFVCEKQKFDIRWLIKKVRSTKHNLQNLEAHRKSIPYRVKQDNLYVRRKAPVNKMLKRKVQNPLVQSILEESLDIFDRNRKNESLTSIINELCEKYSGEYSFVTLHDVMQSVYQHSRIDNIVKREARIEVDA